MCDQNERVMLCVDDEPVVLTSLQQELAEHFGDDYLYEIAENAEEALEMIAELLDEGLKILIIVSDWLMPGLKGDEFLIRVHRQHPDIIKILLTGQADSDAVERAKREANLHACLRKPWKKDDLTRIIASGVRDREHVL